LSVCVCVYVCVCAYVSLQIYVQFSWVTLLCKQSLETKVSGKYFEFVVAVEPDLFIPS